MTRNIARAGGVERLYDKTDDYYAVERAEMLAFLPERYASVLDVGCGDGNLGALLKQRMPCQVWGVDIDEQAVDIAKSRLDDARCASITDCLKDLPDDHFDLVFFNDVLEHLVDPYDLLERIQDKLRVDGRVVASIPNVRYYKVLLGLLVDRDWRYEAHGVMDRTHLRFFTRKSMVRMFEEAGLRIEQVAPINKADSRKPLLMRLLSLGLLGSDIDYLQFVVVATRTRTE